MGGRQNPTHRSSADTLHVSARSMWPALSPLVSYSIAFSTAACGHAPRRAGLGGRPRSRTRCGHARWLRWLRAAKADRLGCELPQPPFLYLDHVQAVRGHAGWPRVSGVRASVAMKGCRRGSHRRSAAGAPVQLSEFDIAVDLETFGPLTRAGRAARVLGDAPGVLLGGPPQASWHAAEVARG